MAEKKYVAEVTIIKVQQSSWQHMAKKYDWGGNTVSETEKLKANSKRNKSLNNFPLNAPLYLKKLDFARHGSTSPLKANPQQCK